MRTKVINFIFWNKNKQRAGKYSGVYDRNYHHSRADLSKVATLKEIGYLMNTYNLNSWNIFTSRFLSRNQTIFVFKTGIKFNKNSMWIDKESNSSWTWTLHKKWSFPLRISSVNVTKSVASCGFSHIYWRNP